MVLIEGSARARLSVGSSALALALAAAGAHAQTAPQPQASTNRVSEIVVTAERRATDIQKTPVAITALPAQTLDKSFVTNIAGLNGHVPSLQSTQTSGFENIVTIRGIGSGTPENDLTTVPGVSLFEDGVYLINTITLSQTLFDVDHIEVLRGPQGALYGQSSIGGAINIITRQPELGHFSGAGDFSVGDYSLWRGRAWVNIPGGDTFAARLSYQHYEHAGFTNDLAIPGFREDDANEDSGKIALLWKPISSFTATLTGEWYAQNEHGQAQKNINDPEPSPWQIYQDYPSRNALRSQFYHLNLEYDGPGFTVRSVTGYQGLDSVLQEDSSRSAIVLLCPLGTETQGCYDDVAGWNTSVHSWTEEFDILSQPGSRLDWIVGGFLLRNTSRQFVAEFEGGAQPNPPDVGIKPDIMTNPPNNLAYGNLSIVHRDSESLFAQATWHVTPRLRLTGGARYNHDTYDDNLVNFHTPLFGPGSSGDNKESDSVGTWRADVQYDLTPDNLLYASAARGYKPGGVNGDLLAIVVPLTFKPETNTAFEIGSKNTFLGGALRFNVDGFYYLYKNMQYIEDDPRPFNGGIANIPDVHIWGVEAEAFYNGLDDRLHLAGQIALENGSVQGDTFTIDSTVANAIESQGPPSPCAFGGAFYNPACWDAVIAAEKNIRGNTPPAMPKESGEIDASYDIPIRWGTLTPRVEYIYRGSEWARIFNEPSLDYLPSFGVTNFNLAFVPAGSSRLRFELAVTNAFNTAGVNSRYTDPFGTGQTSQQFIAPRQVIFTAGYAF